MLTRTDYYLVKLSKILYSGFQMLLLEHFHYFSGVLNGHSDYETYLKHIPLLGMYDQVKSDSSLHYRDKNTI